MFRLVKTLLIAAMISIFSAPSKGNERPAQVNDPGMMAYAAGHYWTAERAWSGITYSTTLPVEGARLAKMIANFNLGVMSWEGRISEENSAEAARLFRQSAEQGLAVAQNNLGVMYSEGLGVEKNSAEAMRWFRLAANQGLAKAQWNLGITLSASGNVVEAVRWYRLAAEQGEAGAQSDLGEIYRIGIGVPENAQEAVRWFRLAAEQNYGFGQLNLGAMYQNGHGISQNYREALRLYTLAADGGNSEAQYNIAIMHMNGIGVPQNNSSAKQFFSLSCENGFVVACLRLSRIHLSERNFYQAYRYLYIAKAIGSTGLDEILDSVSSSMSRSSKLDAESTARAIIFDKISPNLSNSLKKLITMKQNGVINIPLIALFEDGYENNSVERAYQALIDVRYNDAILIAIPFALQGDPKAQYIVGDVLYGMGIESNAYSEIVFWFNASANQGFTQAKFMLGLTYQNRIYSGRNADLSFNLIKTAADEGYDHAQWTLARMYFTGGEVIQDHERAAHYFLMAANQGHSLAQLQMGFIKYHGIGVDQDYRAAFEWFNRSAEQVRDGAAEYNIGVMYARGQGVTQDYREAERWFRSATEVRYGYSSAADALAYLYSQRLITPRDDAELRQWTERINESSLSLDSLAVRSR